MCDHIVTSNNVAQRRQVYGHLTYTAYVDLHTAFDSLSQSLLCLLLTILRFPDKLVSLIMTQYSNSVSCVRSSRSESAWFTIETGRLCIGTGLFRYGCGLVAGKNCWHGHEWSLICSAITFRFGFYRRCRSTCRFYTFSCKPRSH